jgi:hypothetical protein
MAGKWQHYRGTWHGAYYMHGGRMHAHVTQYANSMPDIVVRDPKSGIVRFHPSVIVRDIAGAQAVVEKRLALLHPELFAQREMEV